MMNIEKDYLGGISDPWGIGYKIRYEDNRPEGTALLIFTQAFRTLCTDKFQSEGIPDDAKIGEIAQFYPNGTVEYYDKLCHQGVGNTVIDIILDDIKQYDGIAATALTKSKEMKSLLDKKEFEYAGFLVYFKLFKEE